ncbi:MAG: ABC transporter permease [Thiobacillus sp.]
MTMKYTDIIITASSNMLRSKVRTLLTILAIFIGAFTISLTVGVNIGVNDYINKQLGMYGKGDTLEIQANSVGENLGASGPKKYNPDKAGDSSGVISQIKFLTDQDISKIQSIKGIKKVEPYKMVSTDYIVGKNGQKYEAKLYGSYEGMVIDTADGEAVGLNTNQLQVDIPIDYVKPLGYSSNNDAIGKTVKIATTNQVTRKQSEVEATIVGVSNKNIIQSMFIIANKATINKIYDLSTNGLPNNLKNRYITSLAQVDNGLSANKIDEIKKTLKDKGYTALTVDDQIGIIRDVVNAITAVLTAFGGIALLAASFGIINTLYMAVQERTREIGLMKAVGLSSSKVFALFSVEAAMIGFWGSLLGVVAALGVGTLVNQITSDTVLKSLTGFTLIQITPIAIIVIMLVVMTIAFLAGTLPARRAAKLDPIEALRYE